MRFLPILLMATLALHADDSIRALLKSGGAHEEAGRLTEAARAYEEARVRAERAGDREKLAEALILLGYLQYDRGEMNDSLVSLRRGYDLARELGEVIRRQPQRGILDRLRHEDDRNPEPGDERHRQVD